MEKVKRLHRDLPHISIDQRRAARRLLVTIEQLPAEKWKTPLRDQTADLLHAGARTVRRRESDAQTDRRRRKLIGARIKRETAGRYERAARDSGRSVYRFVCDALEAEYARTVAAGPQRNGPGESARA